MIASIDVNRTATTSAAATAPKPLQKATSISSANNRINRIVSDSKHSKVSKEFQMTLSPSLVFDFPNVSAFWLPLASVGLARVSLLLARFGPRRPAQVQHLDFPRSKRSGLVVSFVLCQGNRQPPRGREPGMRHRKGGHTVLCHVMAGSSAARLPCQHGSGCHQASQTVLRWYLVLVVGCRDSGCKPVLVRFVGLHGARAKSCSNCFRTISVLQASVHSVC